MACVNMAIAMQRRMRELQAEWRDRGLQKPFQLRIGVNTGYCTVGNFGSEDRMEYTIIGDEVNLAARLQAHAELGGILLSHETWSLVKEMVVAEEQAAIHPKGIARPVRNYKVLDRIDDMVVQGKAIREDHAGVRVLVDLRKTDKASAVRTLEGVISRLKT
jgi:class 3 adenylate cyclase